MRTIVATLVLAGALLAAPAAANANAVTFPRDPRAPNTIRSTWDYYMGAGMAGAYWMFVFFEL